MEEVSVYQAAEDCLLRVEFQKLTELSQAIAVVKESLTSAEERVKRLYEGLREEKLVFWEAKQRLKEEQLSTQEERAQFAREATLVAERNAKASDVIRLNVGGAKYETTRSTLCSVPNSMLCAMFSGRHRLFADQEGRIFLDRDPEAFAYVLHFLRTGKYPQCFEDEDGDNIDPEEKTRVETEFDYFCLPLPGGRQGSGNGGYWGTWGETDEISDTSCIERAYLPDSKTLPLSGHTAPIWCVDSTDEYVVTGSDDCTVRVWDTRAQGQVAQMQCSTGQGIFSAMDINCADRLVAAGTDQDEDLNTKLAFWDTRTFTLVKEFEESHNDDVTHIVFHPTREGQMVSGSTDGLVCFFDLQAGQMDDDESMLSVLNSESSVNRIGFFGPDYEFLYCATHIESLLIWHAEEAQKLSHFADVRTAISGGPQIDYMIGCHYLPNHQRLVLMAGTHEGNIELLNVNKDFLSPLVSLHGGHSATIRCFHWTPGSAVMHTGGEDALLCKWSPQPGLEEGSLQATSAKVPSAAKKKTQRAAPY
eukprot:comp20058_c0_seq1/m.24651 comp20058_c0_seq1/g.24651  ORF comp20058_c0_seq1/g.24651 comp20058_c0_seq1/m.24651 type:complete len:532 (-) comp20058_c0_seq1:91-1686(-)